MDSGEIERELEELESRTERLRALYEQYFMGIEKMEPAIPRKDVERRIWILRREQIRNTGLRFKFQMIVQRYNTFQQYWHRVAREIENGTYRRDVMRAAARFGEKDALTILGKKRAQKYKNLIENQRALRESGRKAAARILGGDEVETVDEVEADSEWGDITEVMDDAEAPAFAATPIAEPVAPTPNAPNAPPRRAPPLPPPRPTPLVAEPTRDLPADLAFAAELVAPPVPAQPPPTAATKSFGGLRWSQTPPRLQAPSDAGVSAPPPAPGAVSSPLVPPPARAPEPVQPRRRVAELAAEMRARKSSEGEPARVASLDLDFDADMTLPQPILPSPLLPNGGGPPAPPPKRRRSSRSMRAVTVPEAAPVAEPPAPAPAPAQAPPAEASTPPRPASPFAPRAPAPPRIADQTPSWAEATQPSMRRKLAAAAAEGATQPSAPVPRQAPPARPSEPTAAEPAAAPRRPAAPELSDQRIRQIYAKYVETKQAANESTAGVTYERLAESLRTQANKLRSSHPTKSVDYEVVTKDGKTMLKPILR